MINLNAKTTTALVGAVALATSGIAAAAPLLAGETAQEAPAAAQHHEEEFASSSRVKMANVQGEFSFDQSVLTDTSDISDKFMKAAATMCTNLATYFETVNAAPIAVGGDVDAEFSATLADMAEEEGTEAYEMACSCASNVAGGGAIANAEVEGVSLASIADLAQAR